MDFDVYCDESRPDLFANKRTVIGRYLVLGSVWLRTHDAATFKDEIKLLRKRHHAYGEIKWRSVSPSKLAFYADLIDWFFAKRLDCRFRCIVVDAEDVNLSVFHDNDQELGFYKFYYHLLHHWILDFNTYRIFLDHKRNREKDRLKVLHRCLNYTNLSANIAQVQALDSRDSQFIQMADLLTGAVACRFHNVTRSAARLQIVEQIESRLDWSRIRATNRAEDKFNIFKIVLGGGW